jgi:hypothetical protein
MKFFSKFPIINYDFSTATNYFKTATPDLLTRIRIRIKKEDLKLMVDPIMLTDGDTPEIISYKLYGVSYYHWVILWLNQMYDYKAEWPLNSNELNKLIDSKWGVSGQYDIHHYEDPHGNVVEERYVDYRGDWNHAFYGTPITNRVYEENINDKKRLIVAFKPQYLSSFISKFDSLMKNSA